MNQFYVYVYLNPLKPGRFTYGKRVTFFFEPFYIGKGIGHRINHCKVGASNRIIKEIKSNGLEPIVLKIISNIREFEALTLEMFWIFLIGRWRNCSMQTRIGPLRNSSYGGEGYSKELSREEISKINRFRRSIIEKDRQLDSPLEPNWREELNEMLTPSYYYPSRSV